MTVLEETFWEKGNLTKMGVYITDAEMDFLFGSINLVKNSTVLDIGAGAGRFSIPLSEKGMYVSAVDLSAHGLKRLKLKNKDVNTVLSDARVIPLRDTIIDTIVMVELLDCVLELDHVLMECWRILKDGGQFVFTFGNKSSLKGKLKQLRKQPYSHSYREVLDNLEAIGFTIVKSEGLNWLPFNRTSNNLLVPFLAKVEKLLRLKKLGSTSPWVMIHATKSNLKIT